MAGDGVSWLHLGQVTWAKVPVSGDLANCHNILTSVSIILYMSPCPCGLRFNVKPRAPGRTLWSFTNWSAKVKEFHHGKIGWEWGWYHESSKEQGKAISWGMTHKLSLTERPFSYDSATYPIFLRHKSQFPPLWNGDKSRCHPHLRVFLLISNGITRADTQSNL